MCRHLYAVTPILVLLVTRMQHLLPVFGPYELLDRLYSVPCIHGDVHGESFQPREAARLLRLHSVYLFCVLERHACSWTSSEAVQQGFTSVFLQVMMGFLMPCLRSQMPDQLSQLMLDHAMMALHVSTYVCPLYLFDPCPFNFTYCLQKTQL